MSCQVKEILPVRQLEALVVSLADLTHKKKLLEIKSQRHGKFLFYVSFFNVQKFH